MFTRFLQPRLGIQFIHRYRYAIQSQMSSNPPQTKRQKMEKVCSSSSPFVIDDTQSCEKTIGTHNGTFHCDEALAVFLLRQTNTFRDAGKAILYFRNPYFYFLLEIKRSRNPDVLCKCDVVVDVGAVYDEATLKFDHHQRGFTEVFGHGFETKLSSAGLVYK